MNFEKIIFVALIAIVLTSVVATSMLSTYDPNKYVEMNVLNVYEEKIIFGNNCTAILAKTTSDRSKDIELGQQGIIDGRPTMSDSFSETLKSFNITLEAVLIERVDDDYFYSNMILRTGDKVLKLDMKPSDAIPIALRMNVTVYINKTLLEEQGSDICSQ